MKLAKALKVKNQLVGEIAKLRGLIEENNVRLNNNYSGFDVLALDREYVTKLTQLTELKARIARANADIWDAIFLLVELKGRTAFLRTLNTKSGTFKEGAYGNILDNQYTPALTDVAINKEITMLETQIAALQDRIDEFNHQTDI